MKKIKKTFIYIILIFGVISCSDTNDNIVVPVDNLSFMVLSMSDDYSSVYQLNVHESGEVIETSLTSEFGIKNRIEFIPFLRIDGDIFLHRDVGVLHIKNLRTNKSISINSLCDIPLDNHYLNIITNSNKVLIFFKPYDEEILVTIDKNLEDITCKTIPINKSPFRNSSDVQYLSPKHILFDKKYILEDNFSYKKFWYSFNIESNQLDSVSYETLTNQNNLLSIPIVTGGDKFYAFSGKAYKVFDYELNLLQEVTLEEYLHPIYGSHIIDHKIKVEILKPTETGYTRTPNVYDIDQRKFLIEENLSLKKEKISNFGVVLMYEFDLKREHIIYSIFDQYSGFKIIITDFKKNVLHVIPINSKPLKISIL
ncbi:hypothetical protein [Wenyingzhuangia marina]|nr:hypothetical protein [Wenyingzhuangia marina]GGF71216.1 hypothetical protein GCM10011397_12710 [Wenyingzhuangia marina]